jgi:hypothetical protein
VDVDGDDVVHADRLEHLGHDARHDGLAPAVPLVGPRVTEVRDDRGDAGRGRTATGIDERQQLEKVRIDGG